jgi:hypothetical protein
MQIRGPFAVRVSQAFLHVFNDLEEALRCEICFEGQNGKRRPAMVG